jgi:HEAT repeat protein
VAWETAPLLLEACRRADPEPRLEAAVALWRITGEDAELRSAVTNSFAIEGRAVGRMYVVYTLKNLVPDWRGAVDYWPLGLHDRDKQIRHQSVISLKSLGPEARWALPHFKALTNDSSVSVRDEALKAIAEIK